MISTAAIGAVFGRIPAWVWVAAFLLGTGLFWGHLRYNAGQADTKRAWDASIAKGKAEVERLKSEAGKVTVRVETKYVDRIKEVRIKGETIVRQVPVYISRDLPELPGAFRVLHDAAATGSVPGPASFTDAAPVAPQDAASTTTENYGSCRINSEQLRGLQEWVREQKRVNP